MFNKMFWCTQSVSVERDIVTVFSLGKTYQGTGWDKDLDLKSICSFLTALLSDERSCEIKETSSRAFVLLKESFTCPRLRLDLS